MCFRGGFLVVVLGLVTVPAAMRGQLYVYTNTHTHIHLCARHSSEKPNNFVINDVRMSYGQAQALAQSLHLTFYLFSFW